MKTRKKNIKLCILLKVVLVFKSKRKRKILLVVKMGLNKCDIERDDGIVEL